MPDPASVAESIERFAELIALQDDGHTPRSAILSAAGVSVEVWREVEGSWMQRLAAGDDPGLALRFAKTYGLTRLSVSTPTEDAADAHARPAEAGAARSDPDGASSLSADDTVVETFPGLGAALAADVKAVPEEPPADLGDAAPACDRAELPGEHLGRPTTGTAAPAPRRPSVDLADLAIVCPLGAVPNEPLPFVPPIVPPGKRLAFYDTQTGQRLAHPVLIDVAPSNET
jgi:hypothetical protein